jgi:lipid II:glycine glycyltransferase (peptidoglycan interpeptide bridge formation enzyme)
MEARSWLRGTRGVALPFTDECPALHSANVRAEELLDEAVRQGAARRWKYLEIRGGLDSFQDVPGFDAFYGHILDLNDEPRTLLANCESAVGRAVRKAEREGVSVAFGTDLDSMRAYYKLHCRTRAKLGAPPQPFRFFEAICHHVLQAGHGFVALASHQGRAIAGAVFFQFARKAIYKFSASDERFQHFRGPNLVIWSALEKLGAAGMLELNFGRTDVSNEGLRRFKRGWGSRVYLIRYARYSFSPAGFMSRKVGVERHTRFLTMVPVALSRWIGRAVYPHLT